MRPKREDCLPVGGPKIWVRRLKAGEMFRLTVVSPSWWGFGTHYDGKQTIPCHEKRQDCEGHRRGLPYRPKFYLYCWVTETRRYEYVEFPPVAAQIFQDSVGTGRTFRNICCIVKRGQGDKSRLKVEFQADTQHPLPEDKDPWPTLAKLWGVDTPLRERPDVVAVDSAIPME